MDALSWSDLVQKKKKTLQHDPNCYSWLTSEKFAEFAAKMWCCDIWQRIWIIYHMNTQSVMVRKSVQKEPDLLDLLQRIPQENLGKSRLVLSMQDKQIKGFQFPAYWFHKNVYPSYKFGVCMYVYLNADNSHNDVVIVCAAPAQDVGSFFIPLLTEFMNGILCAV